MTLQQFARQTLASLGIQRGAGAEESTSPLIASIHSARQEWVMAQAYFDSVSDPELVDHAIFVMETAQRKYCYLLQQARQQNVQLASVGRLVSGRPNSPLT